MSVASLPPDLEDFAAEAVSSGRYRDREEVLATGVSLLRRAEAHRAKLLESVRAAEAEADHDGWVSFDAIEAEMRAAIRAAQRPRA